MTDTLSKQERSKRMSLVKSKDTKPELAVRKLCRELGYTGYRLHRRDIPGTPDITFVRRKCVIFIHGCFWHGHECHGKIRLPKSNQAYWLQKIERNIERDRTSKTILEEKGWRILVIWECETKHPDLLKRRIRDFLA